MDTLNVTAACWVIGPLILLIMAVGIYINRRNRKKQEQ